MNGFGIKRVRDVVLTNDGREEFSPFKAAYELIRDGGGMDDLVKAIAEVDQQFGNWELTKRLADHFNAEMEKTPKR